MARPPPTRYGSVGLAQPKVATGGSLGAARVVVAPPPTRYSGNVSQAKTGAPVAPRPSVAPPPTRFGAAATAAQPKNVAVARHAPPPTRFAAAASQAKMAAGVRPGPPPPPTRLAASAMQRVPVVIQAMKANRNSRFDKAYKDDTETRFESKHSGQGSYPLKTGMKEGRDPIDYAASRRLQILKQMSSQLYYHMKYRGMNPIEVQSMYMNGNVFMTSNVSQTIADVSSDPEVLDFPTMLSTAYEGGSDKARSRRHARKLKAFMAGTRGDGTNADLRGILSSQPQTITEDQIPSVTGTGGLYLVTHNQGDVRHAEHVLSGKVGKNEAWIAGKKIPCFVCHVEFGTGSQQVHYINRRGRLYKDAALGNPRDDVFDAVISEMQDVKVPSWDLADADSDSDDDGATVPVRKIPSKTKRKGSADSGTQSVSMVQQTVTATQPQITQPQITQPQPQLLPSISTILEPNQQHVDLVAWYLRGTPLRVSSYEEFWVLYNRAEAAYDQALRLEQARREEEARQQAAFRQLLLQQQMMQTGMYPQQPGYSGGFQQTGNFQQTPNYGNGFQQSPQYFGYSYQPPFGNGGGFGGGGTSGNSGGGF